LLLYQQKKMKKIFSTRILHRRIRNIRVWM